MRNSPKVICLVTLVLYFVNLYFNYASMTLQLEVERKDMDTRIGICHAAKPRLLLSSYGGRCL